MSKNVRDFILSLILVIYTVIMMTFFYDDFIDLFPVIYPLVGLYFIYNCLSIYIPFLNDFPGAKKLFKKNYLPSNNSKVDVIQIKKDNVRAGMVFALYFTSLTLMCWFIITYLSFIYIFLLFLLLNLGDYVCVLFWCPFRSIFLKNRCCRHCRIANWDRLMKFWVLIFIPHIVSYILFGIGLIIFIHWEIAIYKYPERFYPSTNQFLRCSHCPQDNCKK